MSEHVRTWNVYDVFNLAINKLRRLQKKGFEVKEVCKTGKTKLRVEFK